MEYCVNACRQISQEGRLHIDETRQANCFLVHLPYGLLLRMAILLNLAKTIRQSDITFIVSKVRSDARLCDVSRLIQPCHILDYEEENRTRTRN